MNIKELTLDQFLCAHACKMTSGNPLAFDNGIAIIKDSIYNINTGSKFRDLDADYALYRDDQEPGNVFLFYNDEIVGFYFNELIAIHPNHCKKKLSVPMILEAVCSRTVPTQRSLTPQGKAALARAWRVATGAERNPWP